MELWQRWRERASSTLLPGRAPTSEQEVAVLAEAMDAVSFRLLVSHRIPFRYRLESADLVPHAQTLATLVFRAPRGRSFRLIERVSEVSLADELAICGYPHEQVRYRDRSFTVVAGAFVAGEPIDGWHWHTTRRSVRWESDGIICELESAIGSGPSLLEALKIAASTLPLESLIRANRKKKGVQATALICCPRTGHINTLGGERNG